MFQTRPAITRRAYQHVGHQSDHLVRELPSKLAYHSLGSVPRQELLRHSAHRYHAFTYAEDRHIQVSYDDLDCFLYS